MDCAGFFLFTGFIILIVALFFYHRFDRSTSPFLVAFLIFDLQHLQGRVLDWMGRTFPKDRQTYEWDVTLQSYVPAIKAPSTWAAVKHLLVMIWVLIKFIWCGFDWIRFFILLGFWDILFGESVCDLQSEIDSIWPVTECDACSRRTCHIVLE